MRYRWTDAALRGDEAAVPEPRGGLGVFINLPSSPDLANPSRVHALMLEEGSTKTESAAAACWATAPRQTLTNSLDELGSGIGRPSLRIPSR